MSEETLAEKVNVETPWWGKALESGSKASVMLAAGIVGVPSLMAVGAGYFLVSNVNSRLRGLEQYTISEMHQITQIQADQDQHWDSFERFMIANMEIQIRSCLHGAKTPKEQDECVEIGDHGTSLLPNKK